MLVIGMMYKDGEELYFPVIKGVALAAYPGRFGLLRALAIAEHYRLQEIIEHYYDVLRMQALSGMERFNLGEEYYGSIGSDVDKLRINQGIVVEKIRGCLADQIDILNTEDSYLRAVYPPFPISEFEKAGSLLDEGVFLGFSVDADYQAECIFLYDAEVGLGVSHGFPNLEAASTAANQYLLSRKRSEFRPSR